MNILLHSVETMHKYNAQALVLLGLFQGNLSPAERCVLLTLDDHALEEVATQVLLEAKRKIRLGQPLDILIVPGSTFVESVRVIQDTFPPTEETQEWKKLNSSLTEDACGN